MKQLNLVLNFYIHVSGSVLYIPTIDLMWNLFLYFVREFSAQPQERKEGQGTAAKQQLAAVPALLPPPPQLSQKFTKITNMENYGYHKWKQIILVVNFLFGLRVIKIPNKTFTYIELSLALHLQCLRGARGSRFQ
jgi:hypothetical protein